MGFPVHYPDDRTMSRAVDQEYELITTEDSAVINRPGCLNQVPALRGLRRCHWRGLRKQVDARLDRSYFHLNLSEKADKTPLFMLIGTFAISLRRLLNEAEKAEARTGSGRSSGSLFRSRSSFAAS